MKESLPLRFASMPTVDAPTPEEVRALREKNLLTQDQAAALLYLTRDAWRQYEKPRQQGNARQMRAALWELFRLKVGDIKPEAYAVIEPKFGRADALPPATQFTRPKP